VLSCIKAHKQQFFMFSEAALESPEDIADTIKGLLPQLEQYSETTLNSVVASLLHELQGTSKKGG